MKGYGKRIQYYRKQRNLSQEQLGEKVGGVTKSFISKIETEKKLPNLELLVKIAEVLEVDPGELISDKVDPPKPLKDLGAKWIHLGEQLEKEGITPEQVEQWAALVTKYTQNKDK